MKSSPLIYLALIYKNLAASALIVVYLGGCATPNTDKFPDPIHTIASNNTKNGIPTLVFEDGGLITMGKLMPASKHELLMIGQDGRLLYRGQLLDFVAKDKDSYLFFSSGVYYKFELNKTKLHIQLYSFSPFGIGIATSTAGPSEFAEWTRRFANFGFDEFTYGMVAITKFIDGTRSEVKGSGELVAKIRLSGNLVVWNDENIAPIATQMSDGALAVAIKSPKTGDTLWIFGAGNFQLNRSRAVAEFFVGNNKIPNGNTLPVQLECYSDLYLSLKSISR